MFDPFAYHRRLVSAAFGIAATAQRAAEMVSASQHVIARRSAIMAHASRSPMTGNYAELGRMAPEKLEAFSSAVAAVAQDYWEIQTSIIKESGYFWRQTMNGRAPTTTELWTMVSRAVEFPLHTLERLSAMGDAGLGPIHATATANAKRLKRRIR